MSEIITPHRHIHHCLTFFHS